MKKKYRDIVVDDIQYGWTVDYRKVSIWKDKKIIAKYDISERHDITPKIVAALIKDPDALMWINALPCPFCGKPLGVITNNTYMRCEHEEGCWFAKSEPITIISGSNIEIWNERSYCEHD